MATPRPDTGAGAQAGSQQSHGSMGAPGLKHIRLGGLILVVDGNAQAMHIIGRDGQITLLPKGAHFNGNKSTIDLPGGDHLTIRGGKVVRNTPKPKTGRLSSTTYYRNPYTGPDQKVDKATGQPSAPKPVRNGVPGPVPAGQAPGSARLAPPSTPPVPAKAAPAKATPAKAPVAAAPTPTPRPVAAPTGGRTAAPAGSPAPVVARPASPGAPPAVIAPSAPAATLSGTAVTQRVTEMFGAGMASYLNNKELGPILRQAATEGWSQLRLQGAIQGTGWWKNTADPARKWDVLNSLDHATAKSQSILDAARADGLTLAPLQVHDLAVNALRNGWTAAQLRQHIYDGVNNQDLGSAEATKYGYLAGLADNPEVKALLDQGAREGWDQNRLQAALQNTNFWKQTSDAQRRWQALNGQDPGSAKAAVTQQTTSVLNTAQALGVTLDPARAGQIAQDSLQFGWSAEQISKAVGAEYHYVPGVSNGGTAGKSVSDMKSLAAQYMVPLSDTTIGAWAKNMVGGTVDETAFTDYLKEQAKIMRPWAAKQIDAGLTTQQVTDPYRQLAASVLEVSPDQVDFTLPKYAAILDGSPDQNGQRGPMSMSQAGQYLRSLPDYGKTSSAREQGANFAQQLTHTFGAVA